MGGSIIGGQSVLRGALVLTLAGILVRLLGAVYRIPLSRILGDEGLGIYGIPNQFYLLFFTVSSAGIPVAVSRLVAEEMAAGHYREAYRIFCLARTAMIFTGLLFSILLFFGAGWLVESGIAANPACYNGLRAVAPVVFFAAVTASYRGFFQGLNNMGIVAASQVVDQVLLVVGTVAFSYLLLPAGLDVAAAGANLGAVPGAVAATLLLVVWHLRLRSRIHSLLREDQYGELEPPGAVLKKIFKTAIPVSFAGIAMAMMGIIDNKLIIDRLQLVGYTRSEATAMYGQFNQMAMSFVNISISFALSLGTSMVPFAAKMWVIRDVGKINEELQRSLRLAVALALPAAAGLYFLAPHLTLLVFACEPAGIPLAAVSGAVVFWSVHLVTAGALQGLGRVDIPVKNLVVGMVVRVVLTYYLVPTELGIRAPALATAVMFMIAAVLNVAALSRLTGFRLKLIEVLVGPLAATLPMIPVILILYGTVLREVGSNGAAVAAAIAGGILTYSVAVLATGGVRVDELGRVPVLGPVLSERLGKFKK